MLDRRLPDLPGIISAAEIAVTAAGIVDWQLPSGMIPWQPGGHADVWNHVEAAMALDVAGHHDAAARAYQWLVDTQRGDGAWHQYYLSSGIEDDKLDANCVAYVATGVWHHWLTTRDRGFLEAMWPVVDAAISFVLGLQTGRGEIIWARHADGRPWDFALLTGSSSISHSLHVASRIACELGWERPAWTTARDRLVDVISRVPEAFAPKDRWAMDWYYPVLSGVVTGDAGLARLRGRSGEFEFGDHGVRCVADQPWVTTAETCECAMAYGAVDDMAHAARLLRTVQAYRCDDGRYLTGVVFPDEVSFPDDERTTYSSAAVILAADAVAGASPASRLFTAPGASVR